VIDAHDETTVEIDSIYTKPVDVNAGGTLTHMTPGQRQAVLIHTKKETDRNYAIWAEMDYNILFFKKGILPPAGYNANVTAWLVYNDSASLPDPFVLMSLMIPPSLTIQTTSHLTRCRFWGRSILNRLDISSANMSGISRFTVNNKVFRSRGFLFWICCWNKSLTSTTQTYIPQKVPSLYTALSTGEYAADPDVYGQVNPFILKHGEHTWAL
jgi:iron transport multicopper oxidase